MASIDAVRLNPFEGTPKSLHPPGVGVPSLAMDDALSAFQQTSGWSYGGLGSAYAEGQIFLGYPVLAALMQRVEYMNAISSIADDMTRKWIEFKASAGVDKSGRIEELTDKFEVDPCSGRGQDPPHSGARLRTRASLPRHGRHRRPRRTEAGSRHRGALGRHGVQDARKAASRASSYRAGVGLAA